MNPFLGDSRLCQVESGGTALGLTWGTALGLEWGCRIGAGVAAQHWGWSGSTAFGAGVVAASAFT